MSTSYPAAPNSRTAYTIDVFDQPDELDHVRRSLIKALLPCEVRRICGASGNRE